MAPSPHATGAPTARQGGTPPIGAVEPDGPGFWSITKHADLVQVNRDHEAFSAEQGGITLHEFDEEPAAVDMRGKIMVMTDPPHHTRYRMLVNKGFTPRMIGLLEAHLAYRAELIVDSVIERGGCEFVTELAAELPLQAIAEIMGVPQEERHLLFEWANTMLGADDQPDPAIASRIVGELLVGQTRAESGEQVERLRLAHAEPCEDLAELRQIVLGDPERHR